ncbi:MAG: Rrf2 family transcriptional regulator [Caldithrix sp.]|nr:Rrf2 family transcriptional regulator [Caldithrix sp.]
MRFSKTTEYAIRVMIYLSQHNTQRLSVQSLHKILRIPYKYLARLMRQLAHAGLVTVTQGKEGGYSLNRELNSIYLYQIVGVIEGLDSMDRCILGFSECNDAFPCSLHTSWEPLRSRIKEMMYNTTLLELQQQGEKI